MSREENTEKSGLQNGNGAQKKCLFRFLYSNSRQSKYTGFLAVHKLRLLATDNSMSTPYRTVVSANKNL